jgi:hypothetical protein
MVERLADGFVADERVRRVRSDFSQRPMQEMKLNSPYQRGPFGWLIGDVARNLSAIGKRDYASKAPEIIEDIIGALDGRDGPLMNEYMTRSEKCIVKFHANRKSDDSIAQCKDIGYALFYLYTKLAHEEPHLADCTSTVTMYGETVPPQQIEEVMCAEL